MNPVIYAMIFGIISTVLLHIAKAMERHGIEVFDQIRAKLKNETSTVEGGTKKPVIYIVGLILNNLTFLWMMLANLFAPPSYFTSMFGLGLIALMLYSSKVLHEPIKQIEYIGAVILVSGTLVLGFEGVNRPELQMNTISMTMVWIVVGFIALFGVSLMIIAYKKGTPPIVGIIFGLFAGICGCLDPIFKSIGQSTGGKSTFLPTTGAGWAIFLPSFIFGTIAFWVTQWGFAKKARASVLVPCYNSMYVIFPILIQGLALPGFEITFLTIIGLGMTVLGIILMQAFKKIPVPHHHSDQEPIPTLDDATNPDKENHSSIEPKDLQSKE